MKKIIKEVDKERGILQVTTADERWYVKDIINPATKLPEFKYVPSVTWIAGFYPKGIQYYKWLGEHGWDESQALMREAGDKGSKIHEAISAVLRGEEVRIDSKFINNTTEQLEELTMEECDAILSFVNWKKENNPESIAWDVTVYSDKFNYGGSIDYICKIDGKMWIIDFKTGQNIWPSYELQLAAYKKPIESAEFNIVGLNDVADINLAVLQVGYKRNKNQYKFTPIEDKFPLFLAARQIWENETAGEAPHQKDYPIVLSPALKPEEVLEEGKGITVEEALKPSKKSK